METRVASGAPVRHYPLPVAGERRRTTTAEPVINPFDGTTVATIGVATASDLDDAIVAAQRAFAGFRAWPRYKRKELLLGIVARLRERRDAFVDLMIAESGKPRTYAGIEVDRAMTTFTLAAEESTRTGGEVLPLDLSASTVGYTALVQRFPIGVVAAISPFNFPLNLVAHKLAPAFAVGNTVVLKPPPQAPLSALMLADACYDAGLPPDALSVVHAPIPVAEKLATDERIAMLSFTGSARVGWHLKDIAGKKKVVLELGGNAAAVVAADADLAWAAKRCALGSFAQSGQVCIKVQRIFVERPVYDVFAQLYAKETKALGVGDPAQAATVVGPLIDTANADRVEAWIGEAVGAGAKLVAGGARRGNVIEPTILTQTTPAMKVESEEVFGPVATLTPVDSIDDAFARVNETRYGLQAGVFTFDVRTIAKAFEELQVGGVIANDYPTLRVDNFAYGGIKDSGFGREGVRYAMDEMTELKTLVVKYR
ncbi:MAG: aldehyde dehydrogenase family protein [Candidatus Eremiobacteraeota bacterium]|nr:aldehyde dehydrogenase family protein [Candidatus Eremiobacteraeota bacterium]MBV8282823.1 aldehyde dehydrogenase family protein [Candidatus Eremiobacteraeota bacterium]